MSTHGEHLLLRVEMWCARNWMEAKYKAKSADLAGAEAAYLAHSIDERDWFAALLVVNRINLGLEPMEGKTFMMPSKLN